ncbi:MULTISPECIES: cytochrome o ubiquinol oxidase subunit IV [Aneurinibacillus]|uniref:Cytochrome o ubiquinol oxidase operon protein cyoD n=1 Tax=Aneurinibacillus thermoaerophilus TaxID=143495 RepID=A0A1G8ALE3_ANETH|nr:MULTISPECIES: cytochrome o ubiquinol oxidase subunit IV [Aneurinibacillus]AMA71503.1 cytochrome o ubiquinol oxidase subunit IV [Aneurinibacillus sp. XH2]MED0675315.1 cytochrome o ubiquinol oxidase subunit IV [Aneurinibacillus thermoaerophilus]MED0678607.1 cytochrome o ubiquinol oxidase subunit IV [Aneurinibacillus thermoaerophilus]MED0738304.1 cytochrome o ubiquinol oxidase subunit IV [Aneurinibacillus thermoaerophilus]MED0756561.1 cytochrome o ubiquinol oxidase subunit IV [Aneurinibacillus
MSQQEAHGSTKAYIIGFILSIVLTIIPLVLVLNHMMSRTALFVTIMVMAVLQFAVQLFFFMHIREGEKPRYNVMALVLGIVFVVTIVAGSIWIMTFNSQVQFA